MSTETADNGSNTVEEQQITDRVNFIVDHRSVIEQAKGMIMFLSGIGADDAFDLLRRQSQQHNVKVVLLAQQIVDDLIELSRSRPTIDRLDSSAVIDTAFERVPDADA